MLEKYDEFTNKKKQIENQQKQYKDKIAELNRKALQNRIDKYDEVRKKIQNKMNRYVNGASGFSK